MRSRKDLIPKPLEFSDLAGRGGGGRGSPGRIRDVRTEATNERARIGGNKPPPEAKVPVERGAKPKVSANFKLKVEPRTTPKGDRPKPPAAKPPPPVAAPAVHTKGYDPMVEKIFQHAAQERTPDYPLATDPMFKPADPVLTKQLVEQKSIRPDLPPMPSPDRMPEKGRALPIMENANAIADEFVKDLSQPGVQPLPFYSTGTVLQGLQDRAGMRPEEATDFMRRWSGQGAATSPRTSTPTNLRNAAFLMFERARGNPLTPERQQQEQAAQLWGLNAKGEPNLNRPGFPMMEMHTKLANDFANNSVDKWGNPKPSTFQPNWSGNMADVTGDTHYIRKTLDVMDRLDPGSLGRGWFKTDPAFREYQERGGFNPEGQLPVGAIKDTLGGQMIPGTGRYAQTEYPVLTQPAYLAAEKMGISPAEVQERLWFQGGPRTNLSSPERTIPDLFNSQIEKTARVLGIPPEEVLRLFGKSKIPFAEADVSTVPGASATG